MVKEFSLKEEANRLMKIKGNARGVTLQTHAEYILYKKGDEGLRRVEEKLKELGYPLKFKEVRPLKWYPEGLGVLVLLVAKEIFNWSKSDIFDMGNSAPKYSFVVKLLLKYFLSPRRSFQESPKYWRKHYDFGELETGEFNEKEKYLIVREKGYKFHPIACIFHSGYFLRIAQYVIKSEKITIEETKCMFKGDPYHEFIIRWI
ncbi:MAG: hypothetical protein COX89_00535 [Candidatus Nealsonbacteria bacterium CG_4_10_14_0_2_um_filter_37_10]|uniref:4-vinyl reductase 4VR domain-containing protein n=3 Tax=Candidatus Nealsoniibacteriota TaxID=1817911 RepID=A0A2M7V0A6_9BACT|nr:MAG: hypothetical protein COU43_01235 [Candidatus Nealsonbacteria bacterium CG10_big_fil_rev_8_21_14_0_10_37_25]PIZ89626.1 MAG: hypothetical protein COX89_00535 [Candidatus Nealsonbacteria bacterium CG_4_10_14_0_2_um_filter_37_10]PJA84675.1 MAG: hypothetical protein CO145_00780 [Candidatus Nealsonbacteria bacterium CG_4_9_14_3_um_filter_37_13]